MILYKTIACKKSEECDFSPSLSFFDARELGESYYPSGYDILEIDTDEDEE